MRGVGEHVAERTPKAESPVTDGEDRSPHAPPFDITQHIGPRLGGLAVPVGDRDQLFCPVSPDAHDDQDTEPGLVEADVEVDPIGVQVDVVDVFEGAAGELVAFALPVRGQPGDHRDRQSRRRAEELLEGRGEVARAHPVQVHQREHLGHLGGLPGPGRQDRAAETHLLPVPSSTRRSSTRGARTSSGPAPVTSERGSACPLRTTRRWPCSSTSWIRLET